MLHKVQLIEAVASPPRGEYTCLTEYGTRKDLFKSVVSAVVPHLQFETTIDLDRTAKYDFADAVTELYADHMATGTGHVAVTIHTLADGFFSLGRLEPDADAVMLNANIREGREFEQQRTFVRAAFEIAHEQWAIPTVNMYAVVTEHSGEQFHEYDRVLSSWEANEADTGAD